MTPRPMNAGTVALLVDGVPWVADLSDIEDLSCAVQAGGTSAFGLGWATREPVPIGGGRVLQTEQGGSVNCYDVRFNPHGHGTHTETLAHITNDGPGIDELELPPWLPAALVTVPALRLGDCGERGPVTANDDDRVITASALKPRISGLFSANALLIRRGGTSARTEPLDLSGTNPPYFTQEAMALLATTGITHLVVDLPSLDREDDGGTTPNHRAWWGMPATGTSITAARFPDRTVTELAWIGGWIADGPGLLSLQIAPFDGDAAPSRPLWCPVDLGAQ